MSASDTTVAAPHLELIFDDGEPLDSDWHRNQINLLTDVIRQAMIERRRTDFFAGGNMFVYYSVAQARAVATRPPEETRHFRGPDVFWVGGAETRAERKAWVVWNEGGRYPDLIVELLSPSTKEVDRTTKKEIYERTFRTPDYFMYDRENDRVEGFRLAGGAYREIQPSEGGRWRVESLGLWLGRWQGAWKGIDTVWLRLYDVGGRMIPTPEERADAERERADSQRRRADAAEAEVARLRARLASADED